MAVETAVAKSPKASTPVAPSIPTPVREQKLREAQVKKFPPSALKPLGYGDSEIMTITAPRTMSLAEALAPVAWAHVAHIVARDTLSTRNLRDGVGSLIILDSEDGSYHAWLRIMGVVRDGMKNPCGLDVLCIGPSIDLATGKAAPIDLRTGKAWVEMKKEE